MRRSAVERRQTFKESVYTIVHTLLWWWVLSLFFTWFVAKSYCWDMLLITFELITEISSEFSNRRGFNLPSRYHLSSCSTRCQQQQLQTPRVLVQQSRWGCWHQRTSALHDADASENLTLSPPPITPQRLQLTLLLPFRRTRRQ